MKRGGREVVLVSSGAIAEGIKRLGWKTRPHAIHELQAAAAVGQMGLAQAYEAAFAQYQLHTAQILLTHDDLADRKRYLNARTTLRTLLALGVIPIINENDTVTTDEIKVGDNDTLGALVANLIEADVLVLLTDQRGLYTADPRKDPAATFVHEARAGDPGARGDGRRRRQRARQGRHADQDPRGQARRALGRVDGHRERTRAAACSRASPRARRSARMLVAPTASLAARKQWLADHVQLAGRLVLDAGAVRALVIGRQEPAADRRDRGRRHLRARRSGRLLRARRPRDRARPRQLRRAGCRAHRCASRRRRSSRSWATSTRRSSSTATTWCCWDRRAGARSASSVERWSRSCAVLLTLTDHHEEKRMLRRTATGAIVSGALAFFACTPLAFAQSMQPGQWASSMRDRPGRPLRDGAAGGRVHHAEGHRRRHADPAPARWALHPEQRAANGRARDLRPRVPRRRRAVAAARRWWRSAAIATTARRSSSTPSAAARSASMTVAHQRAVAPATARSSARRARRARYSVERHGGSAYDSGISGCGMPYRRCRASAAWRAGSARARAARGDTTRA